ncbi:DMT family transporter [Massilia arenosa]|uniref:DMT family transporter n=1 Tax=Zemynaea arenosa TaxID=2561931 RepID=A0A4Y9S111_9BURK|nr:DMT family transporter [Massilia arenosa]TFW13655.1 DMT family transporter [Massilia arenosa]
MHERTRGYAYLTAAMALVGTTVVASKVTAAAIPPLTATAARFALALPCFLLLMWWTRTPWPRVGPRDAALLLAQALAGSIGYTTLLMLGMRHTSATDAGVILGTLPVVAALCAAVLLKERLSGALLATIGLVAGGLLVLAPPGAGAAPETGGMLGNALVLGAVVCEALFILLNRALRVEVAPLALSTLMTAIGLAGALAGAWWEPAATWSLLAPAGAAVAYYALVPTVAGFLLWYAGARLVSAAEAAVFTAVAPVSALLAAMLVLHEQPQLRQLAGIGCVLAAILMLARQPARAAVS